MLRATYNQLVKISNTPLGFWVMGIISFLESSFFPIPPDVMFVPMVIAQPKKVALLGAWCTITSVLGGAVGYAIGYYLFESIGQNIVNAYGLHESFQKFQHDFNHYGFWIVALKGITPIPYKVVTIASGAFHLDFWTFMLASFIARGFRFLTLGSVLWYYGEPIKDLMDKYLGWFFIGLIAFIIGSVYIVKLF